MVETRQHIIHPNPGGPTRAESPYTRKLRRLQEDVMMVESMSPEEHKAVLNSVIFDLERLLGE